MNEEKNIERIEELLRKAVSEPLSHEENNFLAEQGFDAESIPFLALALKVENPVDFKNAGKVKTKVLDNFIAPTQTSKPISEEKSPKKTSVFDFKIMLRYAAMFIITAGAIATTYFLFNTDKLPSDIVAIQEPVENYTIEEEIFKDSLHKQDESLFEKSADKTPPASKDDQAFKSASKANYHSQESEDGIVVYSDNSTRMVPLPAEVEPAINDEVQDQNTENLKSLGKISSNTIVVAKKNEERNLAAATDAEVKNKSQSKTLQKHSSVLVGPYPGGLPNLKTELKKILTPKTAYKDNAFVTVKVIPDGKGGLTDVSIVETNNSDFAANIVAALKKLNNWEQGNKNTQNYMFFAIDFN